MNDIARVFPRFVMIAPHPFAQLCVFSCRHPPIPSLPSYALSFELLSVQFLLSEPRTCFLPCYSILSCSLSHFPRYPRPWSSPCPIAVPHFLTRGRCPPPPILRPSWQHLKKAKDTDPCMIQCCFYRQLADLLYLLRPSWQQLEEASAGTAPLAW
jgi:hypothetical protein